jgi:threonine dehydratase
MLQAIRMARQRVAGAALRTPLIRWNGDETDGEIYLKLENLQPIGSFKLRGAGNAMLRAGSEKLINGVWTASAGNMAQGVAWYAKRLGVECAAVVPDHAPEIKLQALRRLDARIVKIPFAEWWEILMTHRHENMNGLFIHPVCNPDVMAGNGAIGLEILEDLPDVDAVVIPYGGGGLSCGIASAIKPLRPAAKIFSCEPETAAPFAAAMAAGRPVDISHSTSFIDGAGGRCMLPGMWELASKLLDGALTVSVQQTADAIRLLADRHHVIAEGAGALALAAALDHKAGSGKIACIVSGGNLDPAKLIQILNGEVP